MATITVIPTTTTTPANAPQNLTAREQYLLEMRRRFCPQEMIDPTTATLNAEYFRPAKPKKVLSLEEEALVREGLEKFGFGEWEQIVKEYFPEADVNEVRIKAMEIVGKQDLSAYLGRKMTAQELEVEREKNLKEGKEKNLLVWGKVMADERFGVLV